MRSRISGSAQEQRRALVMGAGDAGRLLVAGIQHSQGWVVVGFLDDAPGKQGGRIAGIPVLGDLGKAPHWVAVHGITHIIVALPSASVLLTLHSGRTLDRSQIAGIVGNLALAATIKQTKARHPEGQPA